MWRSADSPFSGFESGKPAALLKGDAHPGSKPSEQRIKPHSHDATKPEGEIKWPSSAEKGWYKQERRQRGKVNQKVEVESLANATRSG
jgi:hypothetical protein